jgi:hypothetical protein
MSSETMNDIVCPMQMKGKVSPKWCDLAQCQQLCGGCVHNKNRTRSLYQQRSVGARRAVPVHNKSAVPAHVTPGNEEKQ